MASLFSEAGKTSLNLSLGPIINRASRDCVPYVLEKVVVIP